MRPTLTIPRPAAIAPAAIAGIVAAEALGPAGSAPLAWLAASVLALSLGAARHWIGVLLLAAACGGGVAALAQEMCRAPVLPAGASVDTRTPSVLTGEVAAPVDVAPDGVRFTLRLDLPARAGVAVTVRGPVSPPLPGDRVRVEGRLRSARGYLVPGVPDARRRALAARGADLSMAVGPEGYARVAGGGDLAPTRWAVEAQRALSQTIADRGGDPAGSGLARAMTVGDRGAVPDAAATRFRDAGVAHVLAVSGLHLGVVALVVFVLCSRLWGLLWPLAVRVAPRTAGAAGAAAAAIAYAMVTGARVATVRALLVALVILAGIATSRRARFIDALGVAALILIATGPSVVFEVSFQLSFAATATLALAMRPRDAGVELDPGPRWRRLLAAAGRRVGQLVRASVWATAATAPLTALAFARVATGGVLANLVVVPLSELVVLPAGLVGAVLAQLSPAAGGPAIDLSVGAAALADRAAGLVAGLAPAVDVPPPSAVELLAALAMWAGAVLWVRRAVARRRAVLLVLGGALVVAGSWIWTTRVAPAARDDLRITFLDVGQGDAAVIELPGGGAWLVDAGGLPFVPDDLPPAESARVGALPGERSVLAYLQARRIRRLDVVVISHPHPDHFRGLAAVARAVDIGEVWVAADDRAGGEHATLLRSLAARGARIVHPPLDRPLTVHGVTFTVLAPRYLGPRAAADPVRSVNDDSLVLRVSRGDRSVLFTGDLEQEGESLLVAREAPALAADVVKVPHHGSRTSSSPGLIAAVHPRLAVISCGVANRFGFPHAGVADRWRAAGARVLRTDRAGSVTVIIGPHGGVGVRTVEPP